MEHLNAQEELISHNYIMYNKLVYTWSKVIRNTSLSPTF